MNFRAVPVGVLLLILSVTMCWGMASKSLTMRQMYNLEQAYLKAHRGIHSKNKLSSVVVRVPLQRTKGLL